MAFSALSFCFVIIVPLQGYDEPNVSLIQTPSLVRLLLTVHNYEYHGEDRVAFAGVGFGGQLPIVLPELDIVLVFTGWNIHANRPSLGTQDAIERVLEAVKAP